MASDKASSTKANGPGSQRGKRASHRAARERGAPPSTRRLRDAEMAFFAEDGAGHVPKLESMAQDFAEQFLTSALTGNETHAEAQDRVWEDELGGPFVVTSSKRELGRQRAELDEFEREAFPTPSAPPSVPAADEMLDEEE